ncbi:CPBP family intramembrane glutamic endopeptidase [Thermanaerothrix daxensis]|nr:CPBP family intramembrane glutamic endopeptidase [Thermanaerothrix daxensis]
MNPAFDRRRTLIFVLFAFGLAWAVGGVVALTGGIANSPPIPGGLSLAFVLIAVGYMWAPALAHLLTRLITREGWQDLWLRPHFRQHWRIWLLAWFTPLVATVVGAAIFFALFPKYFDPDLLQLRVLLAGSGPLATLNPWLVVLLMTLQGMVIATVINSLFTFGEEFGWRAYLVQKLLPLGARRAALISGLIWGVWHAPVIAMGHNYGLDYPGFPWLGILTMTWACVLLGVFFTWITLRGRSVWPAVIAHAVINGISGTAILAVRGQPNPILGPLPVALIGSAGWLLIAVYLFFVARWPEDGMA